MKILWKNIVFVGVLFVASAANAYTTDCSGDSCKVYCADGSYVGTMYWNGTRWSDGLRSDPNKDVVASQMVAAQGSSCK